MSDDVKIEPFTMKYVCGCSLTFESAPPSSPRIFCIAMAGTAFELCADHDKRAQSFILH
ncbi:MAG: hypothetical protein WAZ77_09870 [Candidatus Nitrosopolaris sp.]